MELLSMIAFAVALSLDGFGVGISYGMRRIKIPVLSLTVISLTSSTAVALSMLSGHMVARYISATTAETIGAAILIMIGIWILIQTRKDGKKDTGGEYAETGDINCPEPILKVKIKPLGLVIQILREPVTADFDRSGYISSKEAFLLGLALAMDAFGAGFGAAMTGFRPVLTPLIVGTVKFLLVNLGLAVGRSYAASWLSDRVSTLPGWALILLGVARVIKI